MAKRIHRKRTKGWRMPEGAVYVGRPSKWGNRYIVRRVWSEFWVIDSEELSDDPWLDFRLLDVEPTRDKAVREVLARFKAALIFGRLRYSVDDVRNGLRGKDLACWCPLDQPCHADVLLEIARLELHHPDQCPNEGGCGWDPGKTFLCADCGHEYCYCQGCGDDLPELCDYCAERARMKGE